MYINQSKISWRFNDRNEIQDLIAKKRRENKLM